MARLIWIGVGAVGGVYAYRKGEQALDAVRAQGVAGTAQILASGVVQAATAIRAESEPGLRVGRFRISRAGSAPAPTISPAAIMDTGVIDITDAGRPTPDAARRRKAR